MTTQPIATVQPNSQGSQGRRSNHQSWRQHHQEQVRLSALTARSVNTGDNGEGRPPAGLVSLPPLCGGGS
ncbi:MAG: hypothetical protein M0Z30_04060 [Actinomycetota bacterium]|nr:hypothetical protein [Actinomycetota bacterium]